MQYIVINSQGLNLRTQPTATVKYNISRRMTLGEIFTASDVILSQSGLEIWARIDQGNNKPALWAMIMDKSTTYATPRGYQVTPSDWQHAIDAWARTMGYDGIAPQ